MVEVTPIPAFRDNYIWLLQHDGHAVVVDPGDAAPVQAKLKENRLRLDAILVTHHHDDHIGGVAELLHTHQAIAYAPRGERYPFAHRSVAEGDRVELETLGIRLNVMETPGHTLDHLVYYGANSLFCGDTLFGCGCGRLFEGSCAQMYHSLQRLASLPSETGVYCAHEYTLHNIRFARQLEPYNADLALREARVTQLRAEGKPSLPSTLQIERMTNPFLRCGMPAVIDAASRASKQPLNDPIAVFCAIRNERNHF